MSKEKCKICGTDSGVILHDDDGNPYCAIHFTEYVGYCGVCEKPINIENNYKNENNEVFCKSCMQKGEAFAEKMNSIMKLKQNMERYGIKFPIQGSLVKLDYAELKDLKFAMSKILSLVSKVEE